VATLIFFFTDKKQEFLILSTHKMIATMPHTCDKITTSLEICGLSSICLSNCRVWFFVCFYCFLSMFIYIYIYTGHVFVYWIWLLISVQMCKTLNSYLNVYLIMVDIHVLIIFYNASILFLQRLSLNRCNILLKPDKILTHTHLSLYVVPIIFIKASFIILILHWRILS